MSRKSLFVLVPAVLSICLSTASWAGDPDTEYAPGFEFLAGETQAADKPAADKAEPPVQIATKLGRPKVIDFSAEWCGPCKALAPLFAAAKKELGKNVDFVSIDIDEEANAELVAKYQVEAVPTIIYLDKNGKLLDRQDGFSPRSFRDLMQQVQVDATANVPEEVKSKPQVAEKETAPVQ
jgi:thiol-disulfide isomerase/thioredoxin